MAYCELYPNKQMIEMKCIYAPEDKVGSQREPLTLGFMKTLDFVKIGIIWATEKALK